MTRRVLDYLVALAGVMITVIIVKHPDAAFSASLDGLKLWLNVVLPALLPFFTMAEILMGLGVVHFVGVLLEPLMRPLFHIPGVGGFALVMGLASGYPIGAKITGRLRRAGMCSRLEAERLVSFVNTADPLFMIGAVSVGMYGKPELGITIAAAHYISVLVVGIIMRYHNGDEQQPPSNRESSPTTPVFRRALTALYDARQRDGRPFGELFADSVRESFSSMLFIGGCIMMFSVLTRVLTVAKIINIVSLSVAAITQPLGLLPELNHPLINGIFEITIGTQTTCQAQAPLIQKLMLTNGIIAWSGLSVHTQVAAMVHGTDIRLYPYILARLAHAILAAIITPFLLGTVAPAATRLVPALAGTATPVNTLTYPLQITYMSLFSAGFMAACIVISLCLLALRKLRIIIIHSL